MPDTVSAQSLPVAWVLTCGKQQQVLRPCSRSHVVAPSIPPEQLLPLPAARVLTRKARSVTYTPRPSSNQKKDASSKRPPPTKASYMIYLLPMGQGLPNRHQSKKSPSNSVGVRVVRSGGEGLYGRPRPVPCAHLWRNVITPPARATIKAL
jgi:hypothetical protein